MHYDSFSLRVCWSGRQRVPLYPVCTVTRLRPGLTPGHLWVAWNSTEADGRCLSWAMFPRGHCLYLPVYGCVSTSEGIVSAVLGVSGAARLVLHKCAYLMAVSCSSRHSFHVFVSSSPTLD